MVEPAGMVAAIGTVTKDKSSAELEVWVAVATSVNVAEVRLSEVAV